MGLCYDVLFTPFGWMGVLSSSKGLMRTTLPQFSPEHCLVKLLSEVDRATFKPGYFHELHSRILDYFGGGSIMFDDEPIDISDASTFLRSAWDICRSIPFGETRTYKWLASNLGMPKASRAAGQSMARNRLPIIIPCHRIIASDGGLGGFSSGYSQPPNLKQRLLALEAR